MLKVYYAEVLLCWRFILLKIYFVERLLRWRFNLLKFYFAEVLLCCSFIMLKVYFVEDLFCCFGRLWSHHQEKQLCFCDTWYLLFCVDDCLVCRSICSCIPDSHPHRTSNMYRKNTVVSPDDETRVARKE